MKDKTELVVSILVVMIFLLGFYNADPLKSVFDSLFSKDQQVKEEILLINDNKKEEENKDIPEPIEEVEKINTVEIVATGDILIHQEILDTQYDDSTGEYDFTNNFQYIKDILENADLAIGNL